MTAPHGMKLRKYQARAVASIAREWRNGHRAVLCVVPTGGGKTVIAEHMIADARSRGERVLFVVHTVDLLAQTRRRFVKRFGLIDVSTDNPHAPIQIATVQGLLSKLNARQSDIAQQSIDDVTPGNTTGQPALPPADLVVFDEAHHYLADEWGRLDKRYASSRVLGLTATPERQDGTPLGDMFDRLVVGALYSELIADGHLAECYVYQPPNADDVEGSNLAKNPIDAYEKHAPGSRAFVFASNVKMAERWRDEFNERGHVAAVIHAKTPKPERESLIADFDAGRVMVLCNVYCLTEGVDVPIAACCILARGCRHVGTFLQMAGRVLRPHPSKEAAILIDLNGATHRHGLPTEDREYSLTGEGIRRVKLAALRNCPACGCTHPTAPACPDCGFVYPIRKQPPPRIFDLELAKVFAGKKTPPDAKRREYERLRRVQRENGYTLFFVIKEYKKLFGDPPIISDATPIEKRNEAARLRAISIARKYKPGWMAVSFKRVFGHWPERGI
jgi:superfamily II DNA or RNA helicase